VGPISQAWLPEEVTVQYIYQFIDEFLFIQFITGVVRIQKEWGHMGAKGGAYRLVRHPGYSGWIVSCLSTPVMLDSHWALIPAGLSMVMTVIPTALKDRTLKIELEGYTDYAQTVRFRLLPGIWQNRSHLTFNHIDFINSRVIIKT
jgi:protein-S-isoprenylcysteine O-methyltransferase Ste14